MITNRCLTAYAICGTYTTPKRKRWQQGATVRFSFIVYRHIGQCLMPAIVAAARIAILAVLTRFAALVRIC